MNYFWSFDVKLSEEIDWMFNTNHIFLIFIVAGLVVSLMYLLSAKLPKGTRITKIVLLIVLFLLETGRVFYKLLEHIAVNGAADGFNWWWSISFQMCALMSWLTMFTLLLSLCVKNENRFLQLLFNILFGAALVGGFLTFVYPDNIHSGRPLLHFLNVQTITVHALLIFVPLYLIKIGEFKVKMKNIWQPIVGYIYVGSVSMAASQISGQNFAFALHCPLFADVGLAIPYPWHTAAVLAIVFILTVILYAAFGYKNRNAESSEIKNHGFALICKIGVAFVLAVAFLLNFSIALTLGETPVQNLTGLICLLSLAYMAGGLIVMSQLQQKGDIALQQSVHEKKMLFLSIILILFILPVGIYLLRVVLKHKTIQAPV